MNIATNTRLLELLAAAHALGTLRGGARRRFEALAREQATVRAAALVWQSRLGSLAELQPAVEPDAAVWIRIRNMIDAERAASGVRRQPAPRPGESGAASSGWLRSLGLWRGFSAAGLLATVLAVGVGLQLRQQLEATPAIRYVAVLTDQNAQPSMLVTFDPKNGELVMQRVGDVALQGDKSLELWALPPGAAPRSLGVMDNQPGVRLRASTADVQAPALAITLEPRGGAPKGGGPTGPVLFKGPLVEKTI